jgi:hypothetical protein
MKILFLRKETDHLERFFLILYKALLKQGFEGNGTVRYRN